MPSPTDSVIHDLGYQRYTGPRLGRGYAARSLYVHGLRGAFGLGRGAKTKIFPWSIAGIIGIVAVVVAVVRARTGEQLLTYPQFCDAVVFLTVLFVAAVAPELVSRDLRAGVLPLYFSRPLRRSDYAVAKLAALTSAVWLLLGVPQLLMLASGAFSTDRGWRGVWDEVVDVSGGLLFAAVHALLIAAIGLVVASLAKRRAFAAASVVGVFVVMTPVSGVLGAIGGQRMRQLAPLANPFGVLQGVHRWAFGDNGMDIGGYGPLYAATAAAMVLASAGLLLVRYRRVST